MIDPVNTFTFDPPDDDDCDIRDVAIWMLRVMDRADTSLMFVASVLAFFLKQGGISEKQNEALMKTYWRVLGAYQANRLEIQGAVVAHDDGSPKNIVKFKAKKPRGA